MYDKDVAEKMAYAQQAQCNTAQAGAIGGLMADMPSREMMVERFRSQLRRAKRDKLKADRLEELVYLLEKNPEIARILDLVDAIGND